MRVSVWRIHAVILFLWCFSAGVQQSRAEDSSGLNITADVDSALVLVDGTLMGKTPVILDNLQAGPHQIRLLHPDLESWLSPVIVDSVSLMPGEIRDLQYRFDRPYIVRSEPSGAEVLVNMRVVGTTPLLIEGSEADSAMQIRKPGFGTASVDPARAERGVVRVLLKPDTDERSEIPPLDAGSGKPSVLPLVLSGASSILAGGFSVYFKVQADEVYREYLLTGDPSKLAETRKLDNVAGIALGASQIYLALFSYLLINQ